MLLISYSRNIADIQAYLADPSCNIVLRRSAIYCLRDTNIISAQRSIYVVKEDANLQGLLEYVTTTPFITLISVDELVRMCNTNAPIVSVFE